MSARGGETSSLNAIPKYVAPSARPVLAGWLAEHRGYRLADDGDCGCAPELQAQRTDSEGIWKADPTYHPYYAIGDFNSDGQIDLAVGVIPPGRRARFQVLIIGSYNRAGAARGQAYLSQQFDLGEGLFFGPPRPPPYRLLVGDFASEGRIFIPNRGGTYTLRRWQPKKPIVGSLSQQKGARVQRSPPTPARPWP